jgi:hypothetical protein
MGYSKPKLPENHGQNPFMKDTILKTKGKEIVRTELTNVRVTVETLLYGDSEDYVKIFASAKNRDIMLSLSSEGLKLLMFIMFQLEFLHDIIWINKKLFISKTNETSKMNIRIYKQAIDNLIEKEYILPLNTGEDDYYWINPIRFFKGNRYNLYAENFQVLLKK